MAPWCYGSSLGCLGMTGEVAPRLSSAGRLQNSLRMNEPLAPFLEVRPEGLFCPAFDAAIDPPVAARRAILSHAHSDHAASGHEEVWGTPETIAVYRRRNPDWAGEAREIGYGERLERQGTTLELYPAGHVLGSAQVYFEREGRSLLYTGDFKRRSSRTAVPAAAPPAEILATETTFGLPVFRFPKPQVLEDRLVAACHAAFEEEKTPVVLVYAFGKAQEVALALTGAGVPTVLHGAAWKLLPEFEAAGYAFPTSRAYETGPARPGEALLVPPYCARTPVVRNVKRPRILYLSGWAMREASRADFDADVLIPWSDHADFPELLDHVADVAPKRVVTMHGYSRDFARILTARSVPAEALHSAGERLAEDSAGARDEEGP
jgi:DNA ligase-1